MAASRLTILRPGWGRSSFSVFSHPEGLRLHVARSLRDWRRGQKAGRCACRVLRPGESWFYRSTRPQSRPYHGVIWTTKRMEKEP